MRGAGEVKAGRTLGFRGAEEEGESLRDSAVVLIVDWVAVRRPKRLLPIRVRLHEGDEEQR